MNKELLEFHLKEARDQLDDLVAEIHEEEFDEDDLLVGLQHAYHHLNSAWNGRNYASFEAANEAFDELRKFPKAMTKELGRE